MRVRRSDFERIVNILSSPGERALDTETTGLRAYHSDHLFSVIIADESKAYYFNFQNYPDLPEEWVLPREWILKLSPLFSEPRTTWFIANAKFDMHMLSKEGLEIAGVIHCTEALGRLEKNDRLQYGLDALAKPLGLEKSNAVEEYLSKHHFWEWEQIPGKIKRTKKKFFDQVPFDIIVPYAEQDAQVARRIGCYQKSFFETIAQGTPENLPSIMKVVENEKRFTKTCFKIEKTGILIDRDYCERAIAYEEDRIHQIKLEFKNLTGLEFQDSRAVLEKAFISAGEEILKTDKGNSSFNDKALRTFHSPLSQVVQSYRDSFKKSNTYYRNFLYFADLRGSIHPNIRQGGTGTGRVSCTEPNLQNIPDEDEEKELPFKVRSAFIPRPGFFFFMPDYEQMEYRMMLDYARQMDVIDKVKRGVDVHDATANTISDILKLEISRKEAKTLNFGLLYGMGISALAQSLKVSEEKARALKNAYFQALPFVKGFIRRVTHKAESQGYIFNWAGRRSYFDKIDFCYKAPNYLIQGGCGDVVKFAMNRLDDFLEGKKSRMLMQIHDEILFEIHESEKEICPEIMTIMTNVYPHRYLPLTCSAEYSFKSWGDKIKGLPNG